MMPPASKQASNVNKQSVIDFNKTKGNFGSGQSNVEYTKSKSIFSQRCKDIKNWRGDINISLLLSERVLKKLISPKDYLLLVLT